MQKNLKKQDTAVLIFAKVPEPGFVKTRLSQSSCLTEVDASKIAWAMLKDTISLALESDADRIDIGLAFLPSDIQTKSKMKKIEKMKEIIDSIGNTGFSSINFFIQSGNNFDERFGSVVKESFDTGVNNLVILGADLPILDPNLINKAIKLLKEINEDANRKRIVLGPASGGGIYLVGIKRNFKPEWFSEYKLFTGGIEILQFTRFCDEKGIHLLLLPPLSDIDIEEDLVSLITYIESMRSAERYEGYHFPWYTAEMIDELEIGIAERSDENRKRRIGKGKREVMD